MQCAGKRIIFTTLTLAKITPSSDNGMPRISRFRAGGRWCTTRLYAYPEGRISVRANGVALPCIHARLAFVASVKRSGLTWMRLTRASSLNFELRSAG